MEINIFNLILVLFVAWVAGALVSRLRYPAILGELSAGIIFGPPLLGLLQFNTALEVLAHFGVFLMMLYIGMEINPRDLKKASFGGLLAAVGGFVTPMALGYLLVIWFDGTQEAALFLGVAMGVTSLATKSRILLDLKLLGTRIAHIMLAGAVMTDTAALVIFAAMLGLTGATALAFDALSLIVLKALLFFGVAFLVGLKVLPYIGRQLSRAGFNQRTANFTVVLMVGLLFAEMAELAGLHSILGAFIAGLFLREGVFERKLSHDVSKLVHDISIGFLAPIFFVTAGFQVSLSVFQTDLLMLISVIVVATIAKIFGTALFYLPSRNGWREGLTIGAGMNGRGAVEIIMAQIGLEYGIISQDTFSILVFMAFFTTMTVPVFLKWGVDWLRRRDELVEAEDERIGVIIVGAGPLARKLGHILVKHQPVWMIDNNEMYCADANAEGLPAIHGNALEEATLAKASAENARLLIALTPNLNINLLAAQLARRVYWIPNVFAYRSAGSQWMYQKLLSEDDVTAFDLSRYELVDWDRWITENNADLRRIAVTDECEVADWVVQYAQTQPFLPLAISRNNVSYFVSQLDQLKPSDTVTGIILAEAEVMASDEFDLLVTDAVILDIAGPLDYQACFRQISVELSTQIGISPEIIEQKFHDREHLGSTVLAPGLAIPHLILEGSDIFKMVIVRSKNGVVIGEDVQNAHAVFALAGSENMRGTHLRALSAIAQIVQDQAFERKWLGASSVEELRTLLLDAKRKRFV